MRNGAGKGDPSDYSILDVRDLIPGPVISLQPVSTTQHEIKLKWKEPNINPATVVNYQVILIFPNRKQIISNVDKNEMMYEACGLRSNCTYRFQVRALSSKGSGKTEVINIKTREFNPYPPANLRVHKVRKDAIKIRWDDHGGDPETNHKYKITVEPQTGHPTTLFKHSKGHSKLITGLEPSTEYTIRVAGINESERQSQPATIKVKTKMSTGKRILLTTAGSIAGVIPGIVAYNRTKGDVEDDFYSSGEDYDFYDNGDKN